MYHSPAEIGVVEGSGYYVDQGGYAWEWDRAKQRLLLIAAPGGGMKWIYPTSSPKFRAIYAKIVSGKTPWTGDLAVILATARAQGGMATGTAVASPSRSAPLTTAPTAPTIVTRYAPAPTPAPVADPVAPVAFYQRSWFPFAAAGVGLAVLGLIALASQARS
jgi:hypothetical protein